MRNKIINSYLNKKSKLFINELKERGTEINDFKYRLRYVKNEDYSRDVHTMDELKNFLSLNEAQSLTAMLEYVGNKFLRMINSTPYVRQKYVLHWRKIAQENGQDVFIAYFIKSLNIKSDNVKQDKFNWPAVISSDDTRLERILSNGVYDNHFHLYGSMAIGDINWCKINNRVNLINYLSKKQKELRSKLSNSYVEFQCSLLKAIVLRKYFFLKIYVKYLERFYPNNSLLGNNNCEDKNENLDKSENLKLNDQNVLNYIYEDDFTILKYKYLKFNFDEIPNTKKKDYASLLCTDDEYSGGERALLYYAFLFFDQLNELDQILFNLYLILRKEFFEAFVQRKELPGFSNFAEYDERKELFYEEGLNGKDEIGTLWNSLDKKIMGVEARITPSIKSENLRDKIDNLVDNIKLSNKEDILEVLHYKKEKRNSFLPEINKNPNNIYDKHFERDFGFIIHFIKSKDEEDRGNQKYRCMYPRNNTVRKRIEEQARALHSYFRKYERNKDYIVGIDAANIEIDCRPEVMAQVFRFLRNTTYKDILTKHSKNMIRGITYHVAEDFIDMADGLRAIWEAVEFLKLDNGDRLGHCIALGIDPELYYSRKGYVTCISKQVMLDNCVWLYYCLTDMNSMNPIKNKLYSIAMELLEYIYKYEENDTLQYNPDEKNKNSYTIHDYFYSMFLRGDNPKLCLKPHKNYASGYRAFSMNNTENHKKAMRNLNAQKIFKDYHYNVNVNKKGNEKMEFDIDYEYIQMIREIQKYVKRILIEKKIIIEVNVTSNYLIGYAEKYSDSTLLNFNRHLLDKDYSENVQVSICTDDQGIFLTNLISEFSIILEMLSNKESTDDNTKKYDYEDVYEYINYLRKTSKVYSFLKYKNGNL